VEDSHLARLFANGTAENKAKVRAAAVEHSHSLLANAQVSHQICSCVHVVEHEPLYSIRCSQMLRYLNKCLDA
jgi:hypothetical protein